MRIIRYIGNDAICKAFSKQTGITWTTGMTATVLDDKVAAEMLKHPTVFVDASNAPDPVAAQAAAIAAVGEAVAAKTWLIGRASAVAWLRKSFASELGKSNAQGYYGRIAFVGDSTIAGAGSGNADTDAISQKFASTLIAQGALSGGTGVVQQYRSWTNAQWTGSGWSEFNKSSGMMHGSTARTFTSLVAGTTVEIIYGGTGAPFNVAIDGGASVRIDPAYGLSFQKRTFAGLSNAIHTVVITPIGGESHIQSCEVRSGGGLICSNMGIGGSLSTEVCASAAYFHMMPFVVYTGTKIAFIRAGVNDIAVGKTAEETAAAIIEGMTYLHANGVTPCYMTPIFYQNKNAALSSLAEAVKAAVIDAGFCVFDSLSLYESYESAAARGIVADAVHANSPGYAMEAFALIDSLR